jgi:hypothetical protein
MHEETSDIADMVAGLLQDPRQSQAALDQLSFGSRVQLGRKRHHHLVSTLPGFAETSYLAPVLRTVGITDPPTILSINIALGKLISGHS